MDLGPCAKTHSVKLKTEYEELSKRAEAEKDEHQIKIFNTFKTNYEREVRPHVAGAVRPANVQADLTSRSLRRS